MLFCLSALCKEYWRGHPPWLLSHWEPTCHRADVTLFECSVYIWSEPQPTPPHDKLTWVSNRPTNRPVLSQTGSWEQQRRCLVSAASSARCLIATNVSDGVHESVLDGWFDASLCDTSVACHVALCLSASRAQPGPTCFSCFLSCLQTGLSLTNWPAWLEWFGRSGGLKRRHVHLHGYCSETPCLISCCYSAGCTKSGLCTKEMQYLLKV